MEWTHEQRQVIDARGCNLLVSAAAGSGKTAVLVQRILSMLMDEKHPVDIDRLLIVTFTNAAAGEMRDRIRAAIEREIEQIDPRDDARERMLDRLTRQLALLSNAQITTIHSFCQYVIRNHFHTIDLDPGLRVADEGEQLLLKNEVMERVLEEAYAQGEEAFLHMAQCLSPGRSDEELAGLVLSLYQFSRSFPFPEKWFAKCKEQYALEEGLDRAPWVRELMELSSDVLREVREDVQEAISLAKLPDGPYPYLDALYQDACSLEEMLAADTYSARSAVMSTLSWTRLSARRDARISEELRQRVKELRDSCKKTVDALAEEFFYAPPGELVRQMRACAPVLGALIDLTSRFADAFLQAKQKKNQMDFDDLEHYALQILVEEGEDGVRPTQVAREFADHYEEILIDEYQDSNMVQEMLLTAISRSFRGEHNIFMVGDVKQSIYRFRLARPELFMEKYDSYATGPEGDERRIDLHRNFRSRAEVLFGVNFLFGQIMERRLGNIDYDEAAALYPGAEFAPGNEDTNPMEVLLIDPDAGVEEEAPEETARELEARAAAERIRAIVGREKVWDKERGAYRPAKYGDIVILLRTVQGWADVFARVLTDLEIPAFTGSRTGYFSTVEVQTVLSLLRVIDNPRQDIALAAVLHSPIVGLSGAELAEVKSRHADLPFYEACRCEESLRDFFAMLEEFRRMANYTPIHELLWQVLDKTGYGAYAAAMPGGSQRRANLDMLVEKAIAYETGSYRGLYNFVRYIENLHKYDVDFGEAPVGGQEDAVRILSIHRSKGLEFPIVFVCGMGKQMNQTDARGGMILHADLGIGIDCVDPALRTRSATLLKRFLKRRTVQENLGEELRVLYVAMTRAKEKLILAGTVPKLEEKLQKWSRNCRRAQTVLPFTARASAVSYWDWVVPALMRGRDFAKLAGKYHIPQDVRHPLYAQKTDISIRVLGLKDLTAAEKKRQVRLSMTKEELLALPPEQIFDPQKAKKLEENLNFCYTYGRESSLPAKVSVSELKRMAVYEESEDGELLFEEPAPVPLIPAFLQGERPISGAARGTVYHRVMECLDFAGLAKGGRPDVPALLLELADRGYLHREETELVDPKKIAAFLDAPLARRMMRAAEAGRLFREQQFVLDVAADRIRADWGAGEHVLVQGIIDAYFIEDGRIVLIDYKTDFVKREKASSLYQKYAVQLDYYQTALERLVHLPVSEKMIYSFCLDCAVCKPNEE